MTNAPDINRAHRHPRDPGHPHASGHSHAPELPRAIEHHREQG